MKKSSLSKDSSIEVYNPNIDFFLNKIEAKEYFSYAKQLHGFWDDLLAAMIDTPVLRKIRYDDDYLQDLSKVMVKVKSDRTKFRYTSAIYFDILKMILNLDQLPDNFYFGISDIDFYPHDHPPHSINSYIPNYNGFKLLSTNNPLKCREMRCGDRQLMIKHFLPENYIPFNGIVWRQYSYNGLLEVFFEKIKHDHYIVIVGPEYFKNFGNLLNLNHFHHIQIHGRAASENREQLLNSLLEHNKTLDNQAVVYFFVAGLLSNWLIHQLHGKVAKSFLIDVGQALDSSIPVDKMKISTPFQLLGYKKGTEFKTYKTANPNYFIEKKKGDRIIVNEQKEVVFLDKKRSKLLCYFSALQTKFVGLVFYRMKIYKYTDNFLVKTMIRLKRYLNFISTSK